MGVGAIALMIGDSVVYPDSVLRANHHNPQFFDVVSDLDIFLNEVFSDFKPSWSPGLDSVQAIFDKEVRGGDDADSVLHNRHTKWYASYECGHRWDPPVFGWIRRPTIYELNCLSWIPVSRGAKGLVVSYYGSNMSDTLNPPASGVG